MRHIPYTLLVLAATAGFASAQATAYTTPVGYVTLDVLGNTDREISVPLQRESAIETTVATTATSSTTLVLKASGVAANAYKTSPSFNSHHVLFRGASLTGQVAAVTTNAASNDNGTPLDPSDDTVSLTLDTPVTVAAGERVGVLPFWTLGTLFPAGAGVGSSADLGAPESTVNLSNQVDVGTDRPPNASYTYHPGSDDFPAAGWYNVNDLDAGPQDALPLEPGDSIVVRNVSGTANEIVVSGTVPSTPIARAVRTDASVLDEYVAIGYPVDMTLGQTGLAGTAVKNSPDLGAPGDLLLIYNTATAGFDSPPEFAFAYHTGSDDFPLAGWYDVNDLDAGPQDAVPGIIEAGNPFVIRATGSGTPVLVNSTLPYTLP